MGTPSNLSAAYGESGATGPSGTPGGHNNVPDGLSPERHAHLIRGRAENFQPNAEYDAVLARMATDQAYADSLTPSTRMAVGLYANDKAAHQDLNG